MRSSNRPNVMQTFKLTPRPQSDYRLEVQALKVICKLEKHGYRHNKIIYGFSGKLPEIAELQSLGLTIEEIPCNKAQLSLTNDLVERGRSKSKVDHLKNAEVESGVKNEQEVGAAQRKLADLNNSIQSAKETLGITGTVKILKL